MSCYKLNERVYDKIESILEDPKRYPRPPDPTYFKSIYSPATLMNDWYEKRYEKHVEMKSEPLLTENMDEFRRPCKTSVPDRQALFNKIFEGYGLGQELLIDHLGLSYYDNYTTTYDLMFNHLTKGICGPLPRRYFKGSYLPETDLSNVFGNLTQWGLRDNLLQQTKTANCKESKPVSETTDSFVHYNLQTVKNLNNFPKFKKVKVEY